MQCNITRTYSIKVFIDAKLHFHDHVKYIFSQCVKLLGIVRSITFNFLSLECMLRLYTALMEYASIVWNSITSTDANRLERIQQRFAALCFNSFSSKSITGILLLWRCYNCPLYVSGEHRLDALFLIQF
jgi:hypothetical protein